MKLYIQIENGQPFNHPAFESNLIESLGSVPANWEPFTRIEPPALGVYEKNQTVTYQKVNGMWTDVFGCEQMTAEEITAKQDEIKGHWAASADTPKSWTFNADTCAFQAPTPMPQDGKLYYWDEPTISWVEVTV